MPEEILHEFSTLYHAKLDAFKRCRSVLLDDLENVLRYHSVGHIPVSARVKDWDRARDTAARRYKECEKMSEIWEGWTQEHRDNYCSLWAFDENSAKGFETGIEVFDAMYDLLGARIALYFPDDVRKIKGHLVKAGYKVLKPIVKGGMQDLNRFRKFVDTRNAMLKAGSVISEDESFQERKFEKAFSGYGATHLIVNLPHRLRQRIGLPPAEWHNLNAEIQIGTVVMHAWSEVEHDVIYKPLSGMAMTDELQLGLDLINGIALAGEVALRQLEATTRQLRRSNAKSLSQTPQDMAPAVVVLARDHEQLGAWLEEYLAARNFSTENLPNLSECDGLKELFEVLKAYGSHDHHSLTKLLRSTANMNSIIFLDRWTPLRLLLSFAESWPGETCRSSLIAEKSRFNGFLVVRMFQLASYFRCMDDLLASRTGGSSATTSDFFNLLHPLQPRCQRDREAHLSNFSALVSGNADQRMNFRFQAAKMLAKKGFFAHPVSTRSHMFPVVPGRLVRKLFSMENARKGYHIAVMLNQQFPPDAPSCRQRQYKEVLSDQNHDSGFYAPRLINNGEKSEGRWQYYSYDNAPWQIQYRLGLGEGFPPIEVIQTESQVLDVELTAGEVYNWWKDGKHNGLRLWPSDEDAMKTLDVQERSRVQRERQLRTQQLVRARLDQIIPYRSQLHPKLSTESEKEIWFGRYGVFSQNILSMPRS